MSTSDVAVTRTSISNSAPELVAGLAVIVLTILGLAGISPVFLVAIATIVFGVGLLLYGSSAIGEVKRAFRPSGDFDALTRSAIGGLPIVFLAGVSGIVLGILALLGISALELIAIAVIAFGGALILSSNAKARIGQLSGAIANSDQALSRIADEAALDSAGMQTMVGLAAVVLGILALANFAQVTLVLVALLALGCFVVLSSAAFSGGLMRAFTAG
jgi:hypothetical protein